MGDYTRIVYASVEFEQPFRMQLALVADELDLAMPYIRGRELPHGRWELQVTVAGRAIAPYTEDIIFTRVYPSWEFGVDMAMQDALARICGSYHGEMHALSTFRQFGRSTPEGDPLIPTTPKADLGRSRAHMQDLSCLLAEAENELNMEMEQNDERRVIIDQLNEEIQTLHQATDVLENTVHNLEAQLAERDAQIAALQAPPPPPPPPQVIVEEDGPPPLLESDHEDEEEEEDPEPTIYIHSDGEEIAYADLDAPAKNTRAKKRRVGVAREYFARFKR
jgi:hypothetical protein